MVLDFWYGDKVEDVDRVTWSFYPHGTLGGWIYAGNMHKRGKTIGDFATNDFEEIENAFPQLVYIEEGE